MSANQSTHLFLYEIAGEANAGLSEGEGGGVDGNASKRLPVTDSPLTRITNKSIPMPYSSLTRTLIKYIMPAKSNHIRMDTMFKRFFLAVQLLIAGIMLVAVMPSLVAAVSDGYSHFPAVLPPSSWAFVLRSIGILLLGVAFGLLLGLAVEFKHKSAKKGNKGAAVRRASSEGGITLIMSGRTVIGPPALLESLGKGSGDITINGLRVRIRVRDWSDGAINLDGPSLNGIPFDQIEYAD